ncbi:hypothetical protein P20480_3403 [Pseudoalteromonas sp. BSi20480]|nr:hypothetical protein P20480_3403 [Pseudoalteromonas sp. BSi20480]
MLSNTIIAVDVKCFIVITLYLGRVDTVNLHLKNAKNVQIIRKY